MRLNGKKGGPRLRELAPAVKGDWDAGSRNPGPTFFIHSCIWTDLLLETTSSEFTSSNFSFHHTSCHDHVAAHTIGPH